MVLLCITTNKEKQMKKPLSIRIEEELLLQIKELAKKHERSTNAEMIMAIKKWLEDNK